MEILKIFRQLISEGVKKFAVFEKISKLISEGENFFRKLCIFPFDFDVR